MQNRHSIVIYDYVYKLIHPHVFTLAVQLWDRSLVAALNMLRIVVAWHFGLLVQQPLQE